MIGICDFCGKEKELADGCSFHGPYCTDCIQMDIDLDQNLLKEMRSIGKKEMVERGQFGPCEFCGKEKVLAFGNGFHGCYCADCIRLNIQENKGLLKTMRPVSMRNMRKQSGAGASGDLTEAKKEVDEAFARLIGGNKVYRSR